MKKKIASAALSLLAGLGLFLVVAATPTPASASFEQCSGAWFCAWDGANYTGAFWTYPFSLYDPVNTCWNLATDPRYSNDNNTWSSVRNRYGSGQHVLVFDAANTSCNGSGFSVSNGFAYSLNTHLGGVWNNRASSFMIVNP